MNWRYGLKKWVEREIQNYSNKRSTSQQCEDRMRDNQPLCGNAALIPEVVENHKENVKLCLQTEFVKH